MKKQKPGHHTKSKSCDNDDYVLVEKSDVSSMILSQSFDGAMLQSMASPGSRRHQAAAARFSSPDGLSSSTHSLPALTSPPSLLTKPTFCWPIQRKKFFQPIFTHSNKDISKKFAVQCGAKENRCTLNFGLKLYPNGVNWDQDKSVSLQAEITGPERSGHSPSHASCTLYVEVMLLEQPKRKKRLLLEQQLLAHRRKVCRLREQKGFLIEQFISHDVVKHSKADNFQLLFYINLSYNLGEDWVWVGAEKNLGCMVEL